MGHLSPGLSLPMSAPRTAVLSEQLGGRHALISVEVAHKLGKYVNSQDKRIHINNVSLSHSHGSVQHLVHTQQSVRLPVGIVASPRCNYERTFCSVPKT